MNEDYKELVEYLDKKFGKVEGDIEGLRGELAEFKGQTFKTQDKLLNDVGLLLEEKTVGDEQSKRQKKVLEIHNKALINNKILSKDEAIQIDDLRVF